MTRNILKAADEGRKAITLQADLTTTQLRQIVQQASNRAGFDGFIPNIMTANQAFDMMYTAICICFDAGYAVGLRKGKSISKHKRIANIT